MTPTETLALMNKHLGAFQARGELPGWTAHIDYRPKSRRLGQCRPSRKQIGITSWYAEKNVLELVEDTILHEIAHALDWERNHKCGHGPSWRRICVEVGCKPQRLKRDARLQTPEKRYKAICETCGRNYARDTLPKRGLTFCLSCHTKRFARAYPERVKWLKWVPNEKVTLRSAAQLFTEPSMAVVGDRYDIKQLLVELADCQGRDRNRAKQIRGQLRRLGHVGGLR